MMIFGYKIQKKTIKRLTAILTAAVFITGNHIVPPEVYAAEQVERVFNGMNNTQVVLNNLDYSDVKSSDTWAAEAIFETGALGVMKGYGNKLFGRNDLVTKEQAIAIAYRAAGREAEALKAAEELDNARSRDAKKQDVLNMQFDGYLKLAVDDGLITAQDYNDTLNTDQTQLEAGSFIRNAPAQRQEMAYWLAKALGLELSYETQAIFNSYNDWKLSDPVKVPYIEAILQNKIMNGNGNGYFNPTQSLTREQAAQIIKNSSKYMLKSLNYEKLTGTIESMDLSRTLPQGTGMETAVINVRNINGRLHKINIGYLDNPAESDRNEQTGQLLKSIEMDTVVYKNGAVSNSSMLETGDRIEYIVTADGIVKYIKVFSNEEDTGYIMAQIKDIKPDKLVMNIALFFELTVPDIEIIKKYISFKPDIENTVDSYTISSNAAVIEKGSTIEIGSIKPNSYAVLTITNDIITKVEIFDESFIREKESGIVNGIVEENNPDLGYITLYSEKGTGTAPGSAQEGVLRTYNYSANNAEVYRNHKKASPSDVTEGDSVFLKLDDKLDVVSVSAVSNYTVKYGKIISINAVSIAIEYEDGLQQVLNKDENTIIDIGGKAAAFKDLKDGDTVKLLLQVTNNITRLKRITLSERENSISNIYKGTFSYIDNVSDSIVLKNLEVMEKDSWVRSNQKGYVSIKLADGVSLYSEGVNIDEDSANSFFKERPVYIAVEKDYGNRERAVVVSIQNPRDTEAPLIYNDTISGIGLYSGQFTLYNENKKIKYTDGTIIIRDGRLVSGNSIKSSDNAYVVSRMNFSNSELYAGIINIGDRFIESSLKVYRGRIKSINTNKDFVVESYSVLNGINWDYWNTPKTFAITYNTRILNDDGVVNQRDFKAYGEESFLGKTVYIVENNGEALLISTAPFSNSYNVKGEIYETANGSEINITNAKIYDPYNYVWKDSSEISLSILNNTVIIDDGKIIKASELKPGKRIWAVKHGNTTSGDAYIIFVED